MMRRPGNRDRRISLPGLRAAMRLLSVIYTSRTRAAPPCFQEAPPRIGDRRGRQIKARGDFSNPGGKIPSSEVTAANEPVSTAQTRGRFRPNPPDMRAHGSHYTPIGNGADTPTAHENGPLRLFMASGAQPTRERAGQRHTGTIPPRVAPSEPRPSQNVTQSRFVTLWRSP